MKFDIYFVYCIVVFYDISVNEYVKVGLIIKIECEIELGGVIYLYVIIDVLLKLYFFYIGRQKMFDSESSVVCFQKCFGYFIGVKWG